MDYKAMGHRIKTLRKQKGYTQADMAKACGISTSFEGHVERGTRVASIETLLALSKALQVSTDYLLTGDMTVEMMPSENQTTKMRMLNDIMRVLNVYADEWLRDF